jgi:hypothetical protein
MDMQEGAWTDIDLVQLYPAAVYLGLGGGYLLDPGPAVQVLDLIYRGPIHQIRIKKEEYDRRWVNRDSRGMKAMGTCLIKAVTRLFAASGVWDQGTATFKGE